MTTLVVHPASRPLVGSVPVPPDARIGRAALILAALAAGRSRLTGYAGGADAAPTFDAVRALRALGVSIDDATPGAIAIDGVGPRGLRAPVGDVDCGASASTRLLLCGLISGQTFAARLVGGRESPSAAHVVAALRARGARIEVHPMGPTLEVGPAPAGGLDALEWASPIASADLKGAVLFSGLAAAGATRFVEPTVSADHVERLLVRFGAPLRTMGTAIELDPRPDAPWPAFDLAIPGDVSAAAALVAAAQLVPGSRVTARSVGVNPTRTGVLRVARDMGAGFDAEARGESAGEPLAEVHAWSAPLRAAAAGGEALAGAGDDLPVVCALAARASGVSRIFASDSDGDPRGRLDAMRDVLRAFGVRSEPHTGGLGLSIEGRDAPLDPADIDPRGDARVAVAAVVLGLAAAAPVRVRDAACVASVHPKLVATLRALGATLDVVP